MYKQGCIIEQVPRSPEIPFPCILKIVYTRQGGAGEWWNHWHSPWLYVGRSLCVKDSHAAHFLLSEILVKRQCWMFLVLKLNLVTERNTEKKQSLTRALVVKNRQHLSFWVCLLTAACICRTWIRKETGSPSKPNSMVLTFLQKRMLWCQKDFVHFLTQEIWFTTLWENSCSLLPSNWQKGSRATDLAQALVS